MFSFYLSVWLVGWLSVFNTLPPARLSTAKSPPLIELSSIEAERLPMFAETLRSEVRVRQFRSESRKSVSVDDTRSILVAELLELKLGLTYCFNNYYYYSDYCVVLYFT